MTQDNGKHGGGTEREYWNAYYDAYWPDDWDSQDIEFLAEFLREELDAKMVREHDGHGWVWELRIPSGAEYYIGDLHKGSES